MNFFSSKVRYWSLQTISDGFHAEPTQEKRFNFFSQQRQLLISAGQSVELSIARVVKKKLVEGHISLPVLYVLKPALRKSVAYALEVDHLDK